MNFDHKNYYKWTGETIKETEILKILKEKIDYLFCHNTNYNKKQYNTIIELYDIIFNIEKL